MLKRFLALVAIAVSLMGISSIDSYSKNTECENYQVEHYIGNVLYIYVYTCDGVLIDIYPED